MPKARDPEPPQMPPRGEAANGRYRPANRKETPPPKEDPPSIRVVVENVRLAATYTDAPFDTGWETKRLASRSAEPCNGALVAIVTPLTD